MLGGVEEDRRRAPEKSAKTHLTSFHEVYAPHASLRPRIMAQAEGAAADIVTPKSTKAAKKKSKHRPRLDWATLHQHTFGTDVLRRLVETEFTADGVTTHQTRYFISSLKTTPNATPPSRLPIQLRGLA